MTVRAIISLLAASTFLFVLSTMGPGCANIIPPEGGPRDSLAPVLEKATPRDSTRNFTGNRITFQFDEYVEVDNYQQNLIVSPLPKNMPNVTRKLQTITVKFRDSLEENTTYSLNFGKSVKDFTEGNIYRDFTYTFTTGTYFDSLQLRGNVNLAETGDIDTTMTIMLHRTGEDSAVIKQRPRYVTRVDSRGNFLFRNLPPDTFYVYALQDESGSYRYLSPTQLFAFADSAVVVVPQTRNINLHAFAIPKEEKRNTGDEPRNRKGADKRIRFTTNLENNEQDLLGKFMLTFETPLRTFDSSKLQLSIDTLYTHATGYSWQLDSTRKNLTLDYAWRENTPYHLIFEKDFATDTLGQQLLKKDTLDFSTRRTVDYGKLAIRFKNLDLSQNLVLQFVQNNVVKQAFPLTSINFSRALFPTGEFSLRLLSDVNKNGVWDPGKFIGKHLQPELVKPISRKITVKANWDNQFEIDVNAVAAPPPVNNRQRPAQNPNPRNNRNTPSLPGNRPGNGRILQQ